MSRRCEACADDEQRASKKGGRLRRVLVGERIVALCDEHAAKFQLSGAASVEELRALFREPDGRRSLIGRRAPLDRRVFPPRPEGRRHDDGRRADDAID